MTRRDIPNIISILRILLTVPVVVLLLKEQFGVALLLFAIAGASDGLDGFLAKHYGWESRLGSILDPIADKLLLVSSFLTLGWLGIIPFYLVVVVLARDLAIFAGALAFHWLIGTYEMVPTVVSKINTFFQIVLVVAIVFSLSLFGLPGWLIHSLIYIVLITSVLSGIDYIWTWGNTAIKEYRKKTGLESHD